MSILLRILRSIKYRLAKSDWKKLAIERAYSSYSKNQVELQEIGITLKENEFTFLLEGLEHAKKLREYGALFKIKQSKLFIEMEGLQLEIQTAEELFIVNEIFVNRCYEFHISKPCTVIDIGMNVGIASLYFSKNSSVSKIYSFEPFKPTFEQAQSNFARNEKFSDKIIPKNIGLGASNRSRELKYSPSNRGRMGILEDKLVKNKADDYNHETITISLASEALNSILNAKQEQSILVKMDCEGAEFEIIEDLYRNKMLGKIDLLMMEWHNNQPTKIIEALTSEGFKVFKQNTSDSIGMIYAAK